MIPFSDEELIKPVERVLAKQLYILKRDGGGLDFLGIKKGVVYITLVGACKGCAASSTTLKFGLEKAIKDEIHPELSLINLPGGIKEFDKL